MPSRVISSAQPDISAIPANELVLTTASLGPFLGGKSKLSIERDLVRAPHRLPPPIRIPGQKKPIWLLDDVLTWLTSHRTPVAPVPAVPSSSSPLGKRGAPTKSERMEAARLGMSVKALRARAEAGRGE